MQQKCDGNQEEMLNNTKNDNGLPLCESEETSLDSKSEKSVSIVAVPEGIGIVFPFPHVPFPNLYITSIPNLYIYIFFH